MRIAFTIFILILIGLTAMENTARASDSEPRADIAAIDSFVRAQMRANNIPGLALAITHNKTILHIRGFGIAGKNRKVTPQTPFFIGSLSKSFTALAMMQLAEKGKIVIDSPVQTYLPWFEVGDKNASAQITVRHLLNQTGGLEGGLKENLSQDADMETAVRALRNLQPTYPPGVKFQYFNLNFSILGLIVEKVSGQSYEDYVRTNILEPLKMERTFFSKKAAQKAGLAEGYSMIMGFAVPAEQSYYRYLVPGAFLFSTAEDLAHYLMAQGNSGNYGNISVLSAEGIAEMHRPVKDIGSPYAMGWYAVERKGHRLIHHPGNLGVFRTEAMLVTDAGYGIVMLINQNNNPLMYRAMADGIISLLTGGKPESESAWMTYRRQSFMLVALLLIVHAALYGWSLTRFTRWREKIHDKSRRFKVLHILPHFILAAILAFAAPALLSRWLNRDATWIFMFEFMPVFALWLSACIFLTLLKGVIKIRILIESRKQINSTY
jgi:CubicO group peptidase (beta-lactamase class C family)